MRVGLLLASVAALAACNMSANAQRNESAAAVQTQRSFDVGAFDSVGLEGPHDVVVTVGGAPSVRAEGASDVLDELEVVVEGSNLVIRDKDRRWRWGNKRRPAAVYVTVPSLKAAAIGGSGNIRIDKVQGDSFDGAIGGSGNIDVASLAVRKATFSVAGSGNIKAAGRADDSTVSIAGSGDVAIDGVESRQATVSIVGSGNADVRATGAAAVSIMGSGDVRVGGGAKCTINKAGSGDVQCG